MNELEDATTTPGPEMVASTPGEFAARWNERTDAQRQGWLDAVRDAFQRSEACWMQQHERIDEYRDALARVEQVLEQAALVDRGGDVLDRALIRQIRSALRGPEK